MFHIDRINVFYGDVQVLWDISLRVEEREIVAVIGPNGSGKSTLLRTIVNLNHPGKTGPPGGGIFYQGNRIDGLSPEETVKRGIAIVPEGARVFPDMEVLDNLKMGSYLPQAKVEREETTKKIYDMFPVLEKRRKQRAGTLSGGEQQMLALGRGLMSRPKLLMIDELSLGLAPLVVSNILSMIRIVNQQGLTVLLVEQNVAHSLRMCHWAYVIESGRIVLSGTGAELAMNDHTRKAYFGGH